MNTYQVTVEWSRFQTVEVTANSAEEAEGKALFDMVEQEVEDYCVEPQINNVVKIN